MTIRLPLGLCLTLCLAACSGQAPATGVEAPAEAGGEVPPDTVASVPAVIFIQYLNQRAPALLCEQDPSIACLKLPAALCGAAVKESAERCGPLLLARWPSSFPEDAEHAVGYSYEYRQCILADWITHFGLDAERLARCGAVLTP